MTKSLAKSVSSWRIRLVSRFAPDHRRTNGSPLRATAGAYEDDLVWGGRRKNEELQTRLEVPVKYWEAVKNFVEKTPIKQSCCSVRAMNLYNDSAIFRFSEILKKEAKAGVMGWVPF